MFKKWTSVVLLFSFFMTFSGDLLLAEVRKVSRIAVFPFADTNAAARQAGDGEAIAGMLMTELINSKTFQVVERSEIQRIIDEVGLGQEGVIDAATAKQIGKIYGVEILVFGTVAKFNSLVETDLRLVETESGQALMAENASCRGETEIRSMVKLLAQKIEKRYQNQFLEEVRFESTPTGAEVILNGAVQGVTPLVLNLATGSYKIQMRKEKYQVWDKTEEIVTGGNTIRATLAAVPVVKQPEPKPVKPEKPVRPHPTPTEKGSSKTMLYVLGGAALVGGGIAAATLLTKEKEEKSTKSNVTVTVTLP